MLCVFCTNSAKADTYNITYVSGIVGSSASNMPNSQTVVQGGNYTLPAAPSASGYEFFGWSCDKHLETVQDYAQLYEAGTGYEFNNDENITCTAIWYESCAPGNSIELALGLDIDYDEHSSDWDNINTEYFSYGDVTFDVMNSSTPGIFGQSGSPTQGSYPHYTWCRVIGYTPPNGTYQSLNNMPWVYLRDNGGNANAVNACIDWASGVPAFRRALYISYSCAYNITYDCGTNGIFDGNGPYSASNNVMPVRAGESYTIDTMSNVCQPNSGYEAIQSGTNIIGNGWICSADNTSNTYLSAVSGTWTAQDNYTCTAQWENTQYTLTYICDSNTSYSGGSYASGTTVNLWAFDSTNNTVGSCVVPNNLQFNYWSCYCPEEDCNDTGASGQMQITNDDVVCEANYTPLYPLSYTCGEIDGSSVGGSAPGTTYHILGTTVDLSGVSPSNCTPGNGYTFNRWSCHRSNNSSVINSGNYSQVNIVTPGVICDAEWNAPAPNTYSLTYTVTNLPSGAVQPNDDSSVVTGTYTLGTITNIPTGYSCSVWSCETNPGGTSVTVNNNTITMPAENVSCTSTCGCDTSNGYYSDGNGGCINTYTLTYILSNAPSGVNAPAAENVVPGSHNLQNVPSGTGYTCSVWSCVTNPGGTTVTVNNNSVTMPTSNVDCTSTCSVNIINLLWDINGADNPISVATPPTCEYGATTGQSGAINDVQQPDKVGYDFAGWKIIGWSATLLGAVDINLAGNNLYGYSGLYNECGTSTGLPLATHCPPQNTPGTWTRGFDYGIVRGTSVCTGNSGTLNQSGNPGSSSGYNCWCRVTSLAVSLSSTPETYDNLPWVYLGYKSNCAVDCSRLCTTNISEDLEFRSTLYNRNH